jgi:hypothetical protein
MSAGAAKWVWENSRAANGSLIVLLAIADECGKGSEVEVSVAQIARKARLGDRATRGALKDLERLGELSVTPRHGGISRYALSLTPADIAGVPRQILPGGRFCRGAESAGPVDATPADIAGGKTDTSQVGGHTPADSAGPGPVDNFSDVLDLSSVVSGRGKSKSKETSEPPRDDVARLCAHLADRIEANGSKRPAIDKRWRDAARRMIDIDKRDEDKAHALIDWCQQDHFWCQNIHSMPTFRRQYDKLRLAAIAEWEKKKHRQPGAPGHPKQVSYSDEEYTSGWQ